MRSRTPFRFVSWMAALVLVLPQVALAQTDPNASGTQRGRIDYGGIDYGMWGDPTALDEQKVPGRPLSIDTAIAMGLQNNLDVEVNRYQPYVSQLDAEAAWGAYDPTFSGQVDYANTQVINTFLAQFNPNRLNKQKNIGGNAGIDALIPYWGASVQVDFDSLSARTNNRLQSLNPQYDSGVTIGGSIPLLRGLIWNQAWTQVKTSRLGYDADLDNFTTSVMDTVQQIISAYWNLVATKEQVRVQAKSLESNKALLDQTQTQYDVGVVSKVEVVQAEAGVANSEFNLIVAQNTYRDAQDTLIAAVLGPRLHAGTTLTFDPTTSPEFTSVKPVDLETAVGTAFARRPELAAAQRRMDQGEVQLRFAKNQRLPQLDVNVSYRTGGTVGMPGNTFGNPPPVGSYDDTFGWYYKDNGPDNLQAMAVVSIPLGNIAGRKNVSKARIELRRANSQISQLKQQIIVSVRSAARALIASAQGVEAAERGRIAAEEQLRAEKIRLEHGESTPFDVLQRESALVTAESQKIAALQAFRNAQATLERQQGTILDTWDVSIDSVRKLDYQDALQSHD